MSLLLLMIPLLMLPETSSLVVSCLSLVGSAEVLVTTVCVLGVTARGVVVGLAVDEEDLDELHEDVVDIQVDFATVLAAVGLAVGLVVREDVLLVMADGAGVVDTATKQNSQHVSEDACGHGQHVPESKLVYVYEETVPSISVAPVMMYASDKISPLAPVA